MVPCSRSRFWKGDFSSTYQSHSGPTLSWYILAVSVRLWRKAVQLLVPLPDTQRPDLHVGESVETARRKRWEYSCSRIVWEGSKREKWLCQSGDKAFLCWTVTRIRVCRLSSMWCFCINSRGRGLGVVCRYNFWCCDRSLVRAVF
jgi:hypothetical protein